jgi:hypothetical protein
MTHESPQDPYGFGKFQETAAQFARSAVNVATGGGKALDKWLIDNPRGAAAVGAGLAVFAAVVANKALAIKGGYAVANIGWNAVQGSLTGYTYPAAREMVVDIYASAATQATEAMQQWPDYAARATRNIDEAASAAEATVRRAGDQAYRWASSLFRNDQP